jgi:hypothetical protein
MTITSKFLRDIRETLESDVAAKPSDAGVQIPDSLGGGEAVKMQEDEEEVVENDSTEADADDKLTEEEAEEIKLKEGEDDESKEGEEGEMKLKEAEEKDELKEGEDDESKEGEEGEMKLKEAEEKDELKEGEDDEMKLKEAEDDELKEGEEDEMKLKEAEDDDIKEATDALTKDEELPESFKTKVASIFEAAVKRTTSRRVSAHRRKLVESFNTKLNSRVDNISEALIKQVDGYLDYVAEEWMKENTVAIESSLKSTITEKFISGLKTLFENNYIQVPENKINIIQSQDDKIKTLEKELNEELIKNVELKKQNINLKKTSMIKQLSEDMTLNDAAKFAELCKGVSFDSALSFGQKLRVIKETYFPKSSKASSDIDASLLIEGGLEHKTESKSNTEVDVYAEAISRMVKR